jgi:hypothetical protein
VIKMERIVFGEPAEPGEESLEEITKREIQTLLTVEDDDEGDDDEDGEGVPAGPPSGGDRGGGHAAGQ